MNHSGDAAEQIVRMSLEGAEVAARITGTAAKEIALLLMTAMKSPDNGGSSKIKLKGKERLSSMLKSGKALEIFSVKESDLRQFAQAAKQYGIVYCVLRNSKNSPDGLCDIMVKAEDAPKINRVVERFKFAAIDKAKIESEIVAARADKAVEAAKKAETSERTEAETEEHKTDEYKAMEHETEHEINDTEALLDDLLGVTEDKAELEAIEDREGTDAPEYEIQSSESKEAPESERESVKSKEKQESEGQSAKGKESPKKGETPDKEAMEKSPFSRSKRQNSPSEPISGRGKNTARNTLGKRSVKAELREITAAIKAKETESKQAESKQQEMPTPEKQKSKQVTPAHTQPQSRKKPRSKKSKERS